MTRALPLSEDFFMAVARLESIAGVLQAAAREVPEVADGHDSTGLSV